MSAPEVAIAAGQLDVDEVLELVAREDLTEAVRGELVGAGDELVQAFTATLVARPQTQRTYRLACRVSWRGWGRWRARRI